MKPRVEITDGGRAGSVSYHEGFHRADFFWEFGASPALAFVSGPRASEWDRACPWAAGRQAEILERVAQEVVRQKAPDHRFELDLTEGMITILQREVASGSPRRGQARGGGLDAVGELPDADVEELIELLLLEGTTGAAVEALGQIDHPRARALVEEAAGHRLSVDARLAAAEALHARGQLADLEAVLTRELRSPSIAPPMALLAPSAWRKPPPHRP